MVEDKPGRWRWYHHVILVVAVAAFAIVWNHVLRPSHQVTNVVLVVCAIVLVVSLAVVQVRKRRHRKA
jgi:hypothetical protein